MVVEVAVWAVESQIAVHALPAACLYWKVCHPANQLAAARCGKQMCVANPLRHPWAERGHALMHVTG